jgi:hypothetical protein
VIDTYCWGGEIALVLLEDLQATPARPSAKNRVNLKTLEMLEVICDRGHGILIF